MQLQSHYLEASLRHPNHPTRAKADLTDTFREAVIDAVSKAADNDNDEDREDGEMLSVSSSAAARRSDAATMAARAATEYLFDEGADDSAHRVAKKYWKRSIAAVDSEAVGQDDTIDHVLPVAAAAAKKICQRKREAEGRRVAEDAVQVNYCFAHFC